MGPNSQFFFHPLLLSFARNVKEARRMKRLFSTYSKIWIFSPVTCVYLLKNCPSQFSSHWTGASVFQWGTQFSSLQKPNDPVLSGLLFCFHFALVNVGACRSLNSPACHLLCETVEALRERIFAFETFEGLARSFMSFVCFVLFYLPSSSSTHRGLVMNFKR